jgi:hypothetical protein
MATKQEIEKRRAERLEKQNKDREAQETLDLEAIDKLEAEKGECLHTMTTPRYQAGVIVRAAYRAPSPAEYKRYCDMVNRAFAKQDQKSRQAAQEMLAAACLVYPAENTDERKALLDAFPGTLISLAIEAAKVAELQAEDEGKG